MQRDGSEENWERFYALLGRYVVAVGNAEANMFRVLGALERFQGKPPPASAPGWDELVRKLLQVAEATPYAERVDQLLAGAARRGRTRNHYIHTGWFSMSDDDCMGRRFFRNKEQGNALILLAASDLQVSTETAEAFASDLEGLQRAVEAKRAD